MITITMPDPRVLRHFPEATNLAVLDAALVAVELALREEHPTIDQVPLDSEHDISSAFLAAHLILTRTIELRDLLHLYAAAVQRSVRYHFEPDPDDFIT
jgi:hypothetical protein